MALSWLQWLILVVSNQGYSYNFNGYLWLYHGYIMVTMVESCSCWNIYGQLVWTLDIICLFVFAPSIYHYLTPKLTSIHQNSNRHQPWSLNIDGQCPFSGSNYSNSSQCSHQRLRGLRLFCSPFKHYDSLHQTASGLKSDCLCKPIVADYHRGDISTRCFIELDQQIFEGHGRLSCCAVLVGLVPSYLKGVGCWLLLGVVVICCLLSSSSINHHYPKMKQLKNTIRHHWLVGCLNNIIHHHHNPPSLATLNCWWWYIGWSHAAGCWLTFTVNARTAFLWAAIVPGAFCRHHILR